jgi:hypothetical protein
MQKRLTAAPWATLTDCCSAADSVMVPIGRTWAVSAGRPFTGSADVRAPLPCVENSRPTTALVHKQLDESGSQTHEGAGAEGAQDAPLLAEEQEGGEQSDGQREGFQA